jgi:predicted glycoside hydrolase/deacetylase ChbG (UPF0249 family)
MQGRLTATSVLSLGSHWRDSAAWLAGTPLQVGLHVDLPPGYDSLPRALLGAWARTLPRKAIERSLDGQFAAFDAHRTKPPDYVDGHRHVHQWPCLRDALLERFERHYGAAPRWARATRPLPGADVKARIIYRLGGPAWERRLRRRGIAHNPRFLGVYDFRPDAAVYRAHLAQWLHAAADGALLMCHPAIGELPGDAIAAARIVEHGVWSSELLAGLLTTERVRIAAGEELPGLWAK